MAIKQRSDSEELLFNSSLLESLHYACKYHGNAPDNSIISPTMLSRDHDISPKQYEKVALQVKAACSEWNNVDRLLLTKVIFVFILSELFINELNFCVVLNQYCF